MNAKLGPTQIQADGHNELMESRRSIGGGNIRPEDATRGLGELAGEFFASLGITEERYKAVKVKLHLDPTCGCADRRRWLNEMGARLGVDGVIVKMARWMDLRKQ